MSERIKFWLLAGPALVLICTWVWWLVNGAEKGRDIRRAYAASHCKVSEIISDGFLGGTVSIYTCADGNKYTFTTLPVTR